MTVQEAKKDRNKRLAIIILAALVSIALVVIGGNVAQTRNSEQYAERHTLATLDRFSTNLENNYDGDVANLDTALEQAFVATPISGSEMLIVSHGSNNIDHKVGAATPSVQQSGIIENKTMFNEMHTPGSGRITTNDGDFTYVTKMLQTGSATPLVTTAYHMGPLDEAARQTRTAMLFLGLGALIIIAIAASYAVPRIEGAETGKSGGSTKRDITANDAKKTRGRDTASRVEARSDTQPAPTTQVMPKAPTSDTHDGVGTDAETRASNTMPRQTVAVPAGGRITETTVDEPTQEIAPADVPTAPTPEDSDEIRASDVNK